MCIRDRDKVALLDGQRHRTDLSAGPCPCEHCQHQRHQDNRRIASLHQRRHQDQHRQRRDHDKRIRDDHQYSVQTTADKARNQSHEHADDRAEEGDDKADGQRIVDGLDQQPEDILALRRRSEEVLPRRRLVLLHDVIRERILMRNIEHHKAEDQEEDRYDQAEFQAEARVFPKPFHISHSSPTQL